jgi:uncharacterized membrane protein YhiD involved in acid resistance
MLFVSVVIFLQQNPEIPKNISDYLISELGLAGIIIVALGFSVYWLVKRYNKQSDKEKERLIEEKKSSEDKIELLYTELKSYQSEQIAKYYGLQETTNEINKEVAASLNKLAGSNEIVSRVLEKISDKI